MSNNSQLTYIKKGLGINIDVSDITDTNINTDFTLTSKNLWDNSIRTDMTLVDAGLTTYDFGVSDSLLDSYELNANDKFQLRRISHNDENHINSINDYDITLVSGNTFGNYFNLNGGYFHGFFKLEDYDYELFPSRYLEGITIETLISINQDSSGIFYYMGTRSEDKYLPFYEGEVEITDTDYIRYGGKHIGEEYSLSGYTTSYDNYLTTSGDNYVNLSAFAEPEKMRVNYNDIINKKNIVNISNNVIAFEITEDKKMGIRYIGKKGNLIQLTSEDKIPFLGWQLIDIVYKPYEIIDDYCKPSRKGDLTIYINGIKFWLIENFDEFNFYGLENDKEKQIGVPYNIIWGGGSYGLKHSYHFDHVFDASSIIHDTRKDNLMIEKYFNKPYIGGIQKLRIYDKSLTLNDIKHNLKYETELNSGIYSLRGGRIIRNPFGSVVCTPKPYPVGDTQYSGSDIRRSIVYKNNDGSYRNLYNMIDIKVVVKSRSNPNVELIKFNKATTSGWYDLIYVDDYTYDFIVPDEITENHPNEILFAEIQFEWAEPYDTDNLFEKIYVVDITSPLKDNTIKQY